MIVRAFLWLTRAAPPVRRWMWRGLFEVLAARFSVEWWTFMNYGYHDPAIALPPMSGLDLENRYAFQLYHRVVDGQDLAGQDVLEIGCGRGGGAAALSRYWAPRQVVGVDVSSKAVEFCRRVHRSDGLIFLRGDAEAVPCPDESFDAIVNVESSFCYASMEVFLAEVRRLLRPGGHFLYADIRLEEEVTELKAALARSGLELVREADITANVAAALRLDAQRRLAASRGALPWPAQRWLDIFLGIAGTRIPEGLANGQMVYLCYKFRKPDPTASAAEASLPAARRA
jgi:SAM-dependent methyltransferase